MSMASTTCEGAIARGGKVGAARQMRRGGRALDQARDRLACQRAAAGADLWLRAAQRWARFRDTGLQPMFPLWGRNTQQLVEEMLDGGLRARIVCVDVSKMPGDFAGRDLDRDLLRRLPAGVDPCGENGEFHTFAYAGPMYSEPISIKDGECVTRDGFLYADVLPTQG